MSDVHRRVKLEEFEVRRLPGARCAGKVALAWHRGEVFVATVEGEDTPHGQLRCAAEATARALELAVPGNIALEVLAVKAIEGFDTVITVVSLAAPVEDLAERLVGSCLIKDQPARGAALAVLSATNRLLGKVIHQQGAWPASWSPHPTT